MSITLRSLQKSDRHLFLKWWKDPELVKLTSGIEEKSDQILTGYFENFFSNPENHHFIILLENKAIGHLALIHENSTTAEFQIIIGEKEFWGQGSGKEAIKLASEIAFHKLNYNKIILEVRPNNVRAIRAYQACGFLEQGLINYPDNPYQPQTLQMSLSRD